MSGLSIGQAAKLLKVERAFILAHEQDQIRPTNPEIGAYSRLYKVNPLWIRDGKAAVLDELPAETRKKLENLPPEKAASILMFLRILTPDGGRL